MLRAAEGCDSGELSGEVREETLASRVFICDATSTSASASRTVNNPADDACVLRGLRGDVRE